MTPCFLKLSYNERYNPTFLSSSSRIPHIGEYPTRDKYTIFMHISRFSFIFVFFFHALSICSIVYLRRSIVNRRDKVNFLTHIACGRKIGLIDLSSSSFNLSEKNDHYFLRFHNSTRAEDYTAEYNDIDGTSFLPYRKYPYLGRFAFFHRILRISVIKVLRDYRTVRTRSIPLPVKVNLR